MKKRVTVSIDQALLDLTKAKNLSAYIEDLVRADVLERNVERSTQKFEAYLMRSSVFRDYVRSQANDVFSELRGGY